MKPEQIDGFIRNALRESYGKSEFYAIYSKGITSYSYKFLRDINFDIFVDNMHTKKINA